MASNLRKAVIKLSLVKEYTTSRCTARLTKQVKITPYLLSWWRPDLMKKWPNRSHPQNTNGGPGESLSIGRSAIFCSQGWPHKREQVTHEWISFLTSFCSLNTQYPWLLISEQVIPRPWWLTFWWKCWMIMEDISWEDGNTKGCFTSSDKDDCWIRLPTLIKPFWSKKTSNLNRLLLSHNFFFLYNFCRSSVKADFWTIFSTQHLASSSSSTFRSPLFFPPLHLWINLRTQAHTFNVLNQFLKVRTWESSSTVISSLWQLKHFTSTSSTDTLELDCWVTNLGLYKNSGPCNQRCDHTPRVPSSAGLSELLTWNQSPGREPSWILCTLFATNTWSLAAVFLMYPKTTMLSDQKYSVNCSGNSFLNLVASCTDRTHAMSSRRGILKTGFIGTTLHLPYKIDTWQTPCSSTNLK